MNSPYHCFGSLCEDASFFRRANKQFEKNAVDIAVFNVMVSTEISCFGRCLPHNNCIVMHDSLSSDPRVSKKIQHPWYPTKNDKAAVAHRQFDIWYSSL